MGNNYKKIIMQILTEILEYDEKLISTKALFGGSGICYNGIIFGWFYNDHFYVRGHSNYLSMLVELEMNPLILEVGVRNKLLQYYQVTEPLWHNQTKLANIIHMVVETSQQDKLSKCQIKEARIKDLPNMTLSLERILFKAGVVNIELLKQLGPFKVYYKLQQQNQNISKNILFCLYCALEGIHVAILTAEKKSQLTNEYNTFVNKKNSC